MPAAMTISALPRRFPGRPPNLYAIRRVERSRSSPGYRTRGLGASPSVAALVASTAINSGVDPTLALAVAQQESGLNPNAVSKAGAQGVMQLMPGTAAGLGVTDPLDAAQNVQGGVTYLSQLLAEFGGNEAEALAAYNWGPGNVQNAINTYGANWLAYAPQETQNYVNSIMGATGGAATVPSLATEDGSDGTATSDGSGLDLSNLLGGVSPWVLGAIAALAALGIMIYTSD